MTILQAYQHVLQPLLTMYQPREAANIADLVIEKITTRRKIDRIIYKDMPVNDEQQIYLQKITAELLQYKPVQYALGEAWFMGMKLLVNEHVLIPRPETEELAAWIIQDIQTSKQQDLSVIDIGTGTGCIPIAIKKKAGQTTVSAVDISEAALQVARLNSIEQNALIDFLPMNILDETAWNQLGRYDIIVSNPPYIAQSEKAAMHKNVLDYEPHIALFADEPMLFYKAITAFSKAHLKENGKIYVEINESYSEEVSSVFRKNGYGNIEIRKDMQGKERMVCVGERFS